jgi:branched-subunit amino acid transport protein
MTINSTWIILSVGLMGGTWLLRGLPFFTTVLDRLPRRAELFLQMVPAAALGALVFPDSLTAAPPPVVASALVLTVFLTFRRTSLTVTVMAVVLCTWAILAVISIPA